jgi:hypothetical protein
VLDPAKRSEEQQRAELNRLQAFSGSTQYEAYLASLRGRARVSVNNEALERKQ